MKREQMNCGCVPPGLQYQIDRAERWKAVAKRLLETSGIPCDKSIHEYELAEDAYDEAMAKEGDGG